MMMEQSLFLGRIENPIQIQSCLGKKIMEPNAKRVGRQTPEIFLEPEKMMEPNAKRVGRQTPEPYPEPEKMMEPDAKRVGRQTPEPYPEPRNDGGTKPVSWKN